MLQLQQMRRSSFFPHSSTRRKQITHHASPHMLVWLPQPPAPASHLASFPQANKQQEKHSLSRYGAIHLELLTRAGLCILFPSHDFDSGLLPLFSFIAVLGDCSIHTWYSNIHCAGRLSQLSIVDAIAVAVAVSRIPPQARTGTRLFSLPR
ncbi:hypothetical protein CI102_14438 [Trichoderma harzianum]|uniref:Uncharacterized protein n=1 Tax=Trichoderma harzianum CBS 226.95 TaxID=983964 RepID=A0A2T4AH09_TRIHA|nr:hypothetical protein M431DRAFT_374022 [Trichoderma harzianum CBS 226.95]PKK40848.1 hypothetical protein CI102_14438 [Trichoderma harzianum]PTB56375.1 hypothetical protein M431DRAFT_374022 [Trichoderma harzianum CBS 226.95]